MSALYLTPAQTKAIVAILMERYRDVDAIRAIYKACRFTSRISWDSKPEELWAEILRQHAPDLETLLRVIDDRREAYYSGKIRDELERSGGKRTYHLASAHHHESRHLECDRANQWELFTSDGLQPAPDTAPSVQARVFLLGGPRGLGHVFFLKRIRAAADELDAYWVDVYPSAVREPNDVDEALAGLRDRLRCDDAGAAVGDILAERHLLLLHLDAIALTSRSSAWIKAYVEKVVAGLAKRVDESHARRPRSIKRAIVIVIPVEWEEPSSWWRRQFGTPPATRFHELHESLSGVEDARRAARQKTPWWRRFLRIDGECAVSLQAPAGRNPRVIAPKILDEVEPTDVQAVLARAGRNDAAVRAPQLVVQSSNTAEIFVNLEQELLRAPVRTP